MNPATIPDPPDAARDYARVARALEFLNARTERPPALDEVARHVGLSPFHFQRLFRRFAGVSPKRYLQHAAALRAATSLEESRSVLDAAYAAGLSGPGRLHDLCVAVEAMSPGEIRSGGAGLEIAYGIAPSPFGRALVASTARGICALEFADAGEREAHATLAHAFPAAKLRRDDAMAASTLTAVFEHAHRDEPLTLHLAGTNFQLQVWRALLAIPSGALESYGELARRLGRDGAARAVGRAVGANPVAWLVPCHRVLAANGALHGYRHGLVRKQAMLALERSRADHPPESAATIMSVSSGATRTPRSRTSRDPTKSRM
jgi:AraC family transcriptional regulator of adaptative response/methylated-DNA-[protein]-cysteine methyltransferase